MILYRLKATGRKSGGDLESICTSHCPRVIRSVAKNYPIFIIIKETLDSEHHVKKSEVIETQSGTCMGKNRERSKHYR